MPPLPFDASSLDLIPAAPGVYVFSGEMQKILYVGKAQSLRDRVRSYFAANSDDRMVTRHIHKYATHVDFVVTDDEKSALLLENSLIKSHSPRFNIRLRDDKTYFSLRLDTNEPWPWIRIVRRRRKESGVHYFGPYTSAASCRKTLQFLNTIFPLRTCPDSVLANRSRPCISYEINRCVAPCVDLVDRERYMRIVEQTILFLRGRNTELLDDLDARMKEAAGRLDFEAAADLRDKIAAIKLTVASPRVTKRVGGALDVVGVCRTEKDVDLVLLEVRDGIIAATHAFRFSSMHSTDDLLASFLTQFYQDARPIPPEIVLPEDCSQIRLLQAVLSDQRGSETSLVVPERGEKRRLLAMAERNAELAGMQRSRGSKTAHEELTSLQSVLGLRNLPRRIECFDVSNFLGSHVVGSSVALLDGRLDKPRYRRYKIRTFVGQDDFAGMEEIVRRRLKRGVAEDDLPELLVIDGGPPQLERAVRVLRELGIDQVDVIGLAKARSADRAKSTLETKERVFKPDSPGPIVLEQTSAAIKLLTRARDEAHRFAITYHRRLRDKSQATSVLELVPGIGRRKTSTLLKTFGSVRGVREATDDALSATPGMTPALVSRLRDYFCNAGRVAEGAYMDPSCAGDETLDEPVGGGGDQGQADEDQDTER